MIRVILFILPRVNRKINKMFLGMNVFENKKAAELRIRHLGYSNLAHTLGRIIYVMSPETCLNNNIMRLLYGKASDDNYDSPGNDLSPLMCQKCYQHLSHRGRGDLALNAHHKTRL